MASNLITIATFHNELQMYRLKAILDERGIVCFVKDEYVTQMREFSFAGNSGIKIQVHPIDYEDALKILKEEGHFTEQDIEDGWLEKKLQNLHQSSFFFKKLMHLKINRLLIFIGLILLLLVVKYLLS
jgi:hypothetical protein